MSWLVHATILAVGTTLVGCASDGGETPKRPPLAVPDEVTAINRGQLVGTWQCHELNPYPQMPKQTSRDHVQQRRHLPHRGAVPGAAGVGSHCREGHRQMGGGRRSDHDSDIKTEAGSADEFTNVMAGIGSSIVNTFSKSQPQGSGDVLELTPHKLVFRGVGVEDPPIISCTR